jgi:glycosyltransferase involved in cell wall biosynthesis
VVTILAPEFKIVHLSTSHGGGAGIAARRLNHSLRSVGVDSIFVALSHKEFKLNEGEIEIKRSIISRIFSAISTKFSKLFQKKTYFTFISYASLNFRNLESFGGPENTIFHIHNWFNLVSFVTIKKLLKKKYRIVFTLHDQRLFTGGCHYSLDCEEFTSSCDKCPLLPYPINRVTKTLLLSQKKLISKYQNQITIIAPSKWILKLLNKSQVLKFSNSNMIPNVHNKMLSKIVLKNYDQPSEKSDLKIGIASVDRFSPLKGGDLVEKIQHVIVEAGIQVKLLYLSDYFQTKLNPESFWSSIDYLLVLSRADNSPNVIHEAKIRGLPVIGTNVGGISELLDLTYDFHIDMKENVVSQVLEIFKKISSENLITNSNQIRENYLKYSSNALQDLIDVYRNVLK